MKNSLQTIMESNSISLLAVDKYQSASHHYLDWVEFYDPVNQSRSCFSGQLTFLDRLNPFRASPVLVHIILPETDNCPS